MNPDQPQQDMQQENQPPVENQPGVFLNFFKTKKVLFIVGGFILLLILSSFLFFSPKQQTKPQPTKPQLAKIWEIALSFDQKTQKLSLKEINIKEGNATSSNFGLSPYKLYVLDANNKKLFQTDIHITESILYMIDSVPEGSGSAIPENLEPLESIVYAPYLKDAVKIEIYKKDVRVLEFSPPKSISFNLIKKAFAAQTTNVCANSLNLVFISDGYSSEATFNNNVQTVIQKFVSLYPYSENPKIMDFSRVIYNTQSLGCKYGTQLNSSCLKGAETIARNITFARYPELQGLDSDHLKFIILVDADPQAISGGSILGVASGIGAPIGAFQTHKYLTKVSAHEILGHAAGYLYDRYIYPAGTQNSTQRTAVPESNCSANPSGASFWSQIPGTGAYPGCTSNYLYAPFPRDCPGDGGYSQTMMSKGGCTQVEKFDAVEEAWISSNIISKYQECSTSVIPPVDPNLTTSTTTSTSPPASELPYLGGKAFLDNNPTNTRLDPGEPGLAGVKITLSQTNGSYSNPVFSDSNGDYHFSNIPDGTYTVVAEYGTTVRSINPFPVDSSHDNYSGANIPFPPDTIVVTTSTTTTSTTLPQDIPTDESPTPTPYITAKCTFDPATCFSKKGTIQQCTLICTPDK